MIRRSVSGLEAGRAGAKSAARRARGLRPAFEPLEGRALLSFFGSVQRVSFNTQATDNMESDIASSANGTAVVVSINAFTPNDHDIWAQRLDSAGHPVGGPITVDFSTDDSFDPRVAMDSQGRFVVTWDDFRTNNTARIMMSYFDAAGNALAS